MCVCIYIHIKYLINFFSPIFLGDISPPTIYIAALFPNLNTTIEFAYNDQIKNISLTPSSTYWIYCSKEGVPPNFIRWYHDGILLRDNFFDTISAATRRTSSMLLILKPFLAASNGIYRCEVGDASCTFVITESEYFQSIALISSREV